MKEYKVVTYTKFKWGNRDKQIEDFLNEYARNGWCVIQTNIAMNRFILERDKNR